MPRLRPLGHRCLTKYQMMQVYSHYFRTNVRYESLNFYKRQLLLVFLNIPMSMKNQELKVCIEQGSNLRLRRESSLNAPPQTTRPSMLINTPCGARTRGPTIKSRMLCQTELRELMLLTNTEVVRELCTRRHRIGDFCLSRVSVCLSSLSIVFPNCHQNSIFFQSNRNLIRVGIFKGSSGKSYPSKLIISIGDKCCSQF